MNASTNAFQRTFVNEVKRINDLERKLSKFRFKIGFAIAQAEKVKIQVKPSDPLAPYAASRSQAAVDQLDSTLTALESRLLQMNSSEESLNRKFLELSELRHVLRETATFFNTSDRINEQYNTEESQFLNDTTSTGYLNPVSPTSSDPVIVGMGANIGIGFVAGVIPRSRVSIFERVLFRALRGNMLMNHAEIQDVIMDPNSDSETLKDVFIVFAHGDQLLSKIRKISESMGATLYHVDENADKRRESALEVMARIEDLEHVLENTRATKRDELSNVADDLQPWQVLLTKEKAIYHAMNKMSFDTSRKALIAEGWCPTSKLGTVQYSLRSVTDRTGSTIPPILNEIVSTKTPPTSQKTNRVTKGFQNIVDAYGVAKYGEVNPGLFTIITFPFLFAVMFGDFGHGIIASIGAIFIVANEEKLSKIKDEIWQMFFSGRYLLLLMSFFSIFTGLVYNDIFSVSTSLMGPSGWEFEKNNDTNRWVGKNVHMYGFGIDPV